METMIRIPEVSSKIEPHSTDSHFLRLCGTKELVFLEIQGSFTRLDPEERKIGRLVQQEDGRIYLYVGYQKMEGRVVELKKPFAVLKRAEDGHGEPRSQVDMTLVDVCRKKIYFGIRPEPLNEMDG